MQVRRRSIEPRWVSLHSSSLDLGETAMSNLERPRSQQKSGPNPDTAAASACPSNVDIRGPDNSWRKWRPGIIVISPISETQ